MNNQQKETVTLGALARLFLKIGIIGFGGPAAHIAMMQEEVVRKRQWLDEQEFLDILGATNLIPGPNSTEMSMHIGLVKAGWKGLLVAGICFITPAVLITGIFAWLYALYGELPAVQPFIYGIKPAILAVVLGAVLPMAKKSLKSTALILIGIAVLTGSFLQISEIYLLFGAGFIAIAVQAIRTQNQINGIVPLVFTPLLKTGLLTSTNTQLFWIFLKIGSILYGSGYVLFAFLDGELVSRGLITRQVLVDAIAVGQFTPGPVFSAVTFVGYQINGFSGALVSTIAIFTPSFIFVALLKPLVQRMRNSTYFATFLDAVNVASVALIAFICFEMGKSSISDWRALLIALLSLLVAFGKHKINSVFVVLGGSVFGYLLTFV